MAGEIWNDIILLIRILLNGERRTNMPHIIVKMLPGRSEELKKDVAEKLIKAAQDAIGCSASALSVSIMDVERSDWNETVADVIPKDKIYAGEMWVNE